MFLKHIKATRLAYSHFISIPYWSMYIHSSKYVYEVLQLSCNAEDQIIVECIELVRALLPGVCRVEGIEFEPCSGQFFNQYILCHTVSVCSLTEFRRYFEKYVGDGF